MRLHQFCTIVMYWISCPLLPLPLLVFPGIRFQINSCTPNSCLIQTKSAIYTQQSKLVCILRLLYLCELGQRVTFFYCIGEETGPPTAVATTNQSRGWSQIEFGRPLSSDFKCEPFHYAVSLENIVRGPPPLLWKWKWHRESCSLSHTAL